MGLVLSAFSDEYDSDMRKQIDALRAFGIAYCEVRGVNGKNVAALDRDEVRALKKALDDADVRVSAVGSPLGKIAADGDMQTHVEDAKRVCETARTLGADYVRVFSFYRGNVTDEGEWRARVYDNLAALLDIASAFGVTLCHENEANIYGESPQKCRELLNAFENLGCVFDMGNFVLDGYAAQDAYALLRDRITYFHIKDALRAGAVVPPGKGEAQIAAILRDYAQHAKRDFFATLEPHLQTFAGLNALVGKSFDNPYKYDTPQAAFADAVQKVKEIL